MTGFPGNSDFSGSSAGKESACNTEDSGSILGLRSFPGGYGNPLQCSCLESPRDSFCTGIWPHHFMGNRRRNSGSSVRLYFFGSKITADGDCSHEIKICLLLRRKVMTNLDSIFKSRDITLPTKVHLVKPMVFLVVMYGCQNWTIKKAEHPRIDAFELWCWRRLLRVPWTARRSNQSILKEISPGISLEGMM